MRAIKPTRSIQNESLQFMRKLVWSNWQKKQRPAELESFDRPVLWYSAFRLYKWGTQGRYAKLV